MPKSQVNSLPFQIKCGQKETLPTFVLWIFHNDLSLKGKQAQLGVPHSEIQVELD